MIDSFIRHGLKQDELVSESLLQVLAGSDTSATSIRATMLYLMSHPRIYRKLQAEIDAAVKAGKTSSPVIKASEAAELPYLQAVIKEGMRIWPAVTGMLPKVVPPEGDTVEIDGKQVYLPGGTNVGYCAWGIHHNKDVFGEDADVFRPERWLEARGENLARMAKTAELIWGWGKYQCLGRPIATIELNKVFFEVCPRLDVHIQKRLLIKNSYSEILTFPLSILRSHGRAPMLDYGCSLNCGWKLRSVQRHNTKPFQHVRISEAIKYNFRRLAL